MDFVNLGDWQYGFQGWNVAFAKEYETSFVDRSPCFIPDTSWSFHCGTLSGVLGIQLTHCFGDWVLRYLQFIVVCSGKKTEYTPEGSEQVRQDLSEWQERHGVLVLMTVPVIWHPFLLIRLAMFLGHPIFKVYVVHSKVPVLFGQIFVGVCRIVLMSRTSQVSHCNSCSFTWGVMKKCG